MRTYLLRLVLLGFVMGVLLPPFVAGTVQPAIELGGMTVEASNQILLPAYIWGVAPGRLVLAFIGLEAHPTAAHSVGWLFWRELGLQSLANWFGWTVIFLAVALLVGRISSLRARRRRSDIDSRVATPRERSRYRWKLILPLGFVLGGLLPISTLGVIVLSKVGAVEVLWREPTAGMRLVQALLMPGNALLLFGELRLQLGSEYVSQAAFWRSYAAQFLATWCAWVIISLGARFAWLRWLRDAVEDSCRRFGIRR